MISLQNPEIPEPIAATEIDAAIFKIQLKLDSKLSWLSHNYGRSYRFIRKGDSNLYFPEVYKGGSDYYRVTPDNDKSGMCFFVVGKESVDFEQNQNNFIKWNIGIVFNVNLKLINSELLDSEIYTQNLIREVRSVLTNNIGGLGFRLEINEVVREFNEIYREFTLKEEEGYLRAPMQGFRFNCTVEVREDCEPIELNVCEAINNNFSEAEINECIVPNINFETAINYLTQSQIDFITNWING